MIDFLKGRGKAFGYAFSGLKYLFQTQQAVKVHIIANVLVFWLAFWINLERSEWVIILLTVTLVWTTEILNTAVEVVVDLVTKEFHPLAKLAKDLGAAAVMVVASGAILVGVLVLGPPLWERLGL